MKNVFIRLFAFSCLVIAAGCTTSGTNAPFHPVAPGAPLASSLTGVRTRAEQLCHSAALDQASRSAYAVSIVSSRIYAADENKIVITGAATGTTSFDAATLTRFQFRCEVQDGVLESISVERPNVP